MNWILDAELGLALRRLGPEDVEPTSELARRAFGSAEIGHEVHTMLTIYCETGAFALPLAEQKQTMIPVSYYLLVRSAPAGEVRVGLTGLYQPVWAGRGSYWLAWFAVDPQFHGQGHGTRLLQATMELAVAKGGTLLCIETSNSLDAARGLYRRMGFRQYGEVPDYWAPGASLVILARSLDDIAAPQGVNRDF